MLDFFLDNFYTCNGLLESSLKEIEFSVLDFETTGLYPYNGDRIIEIGIVRVGWNKNLDEFSSLVNPQIPIPPEVSKINHITDAMIQEAPTMDTFLDGILKFIGNSVVVGHNLNFDMSFLNFQLQKIQKNKIDLWLVDTLKVAKAVLPDLGRYSLGFITQALEIQLNEAHRALADAKATATLLQTLIQKIDPEAHLKELQPFKIH